MSEYPPTATRCKAPGCDEVCFPHDSFCSRLCRQAAAEVALPTPPLPARGLQGARTDRPKGDSLPPVLDPASANLCQSPDCLEPACHAARRRAERSVEYVWRIRPEGLEPPVLPTDSEERKGIPIFSGVLNYFPLAIAAVARVSKRGNDKHNPGEPLHWSRDKSLDHEDCIARHLIDVDTLDPRTGEYEDAMALAWRALAKLQTLEEQRLGQGYSRGSK